MLISFRWLAALGLYVSLITQAWAQSGPAVLPSGLRAYPVRTVSSTDTAFQDLEFLRQEIGGARVVMLGEPTHGEGNVTEAKIRLIRFLQQRLGFTTVAFESGFYELDKAQRQLAAGTSAREALENSIFPVWMGTQEFQALLPLVGRGRLRVAGFDGQFSGEYQEEMLEELETLLKPEKGADGIAYDYLEECLSTMGEIFTFPPSHQIAIFDLHVGKARRLLEKVAAGPSAQRRERAMFWLQNLRSIQAMAHTYATHDPGAKTEAEFSAADSNPRDAQMADNLLWYLRQHPQEKVICWGALPHLANKVEVLDNVELKGYRPMGRMVKAALGPDAMYVLGTVSGGGVYGFGPWGKHTPVPTPAPGSLEAELLAQGQEYSFVSLKHDAPGREFTTYAFEYQPVAGRWSEVVDGFLYLKTVTPPHGVAPVALEATPAEAPVPVAEMASAQPQRLNPAARPAAKVGAALTMRGTVLDRKTGAAVPFATVALPGRGTGTIADDQGRFTLPARRHETVQVSSVGYESVTVAAETATVTVRLVPSAYALGAVRVSGESLNPRKIMKKVLAAIPTNYEQADYHAQTYTHRRVSNFDTLSHEVEYVSQIFEPAGHRHYAGGFLMLEVRQQQRIQEAHQLASSKQPLGHFGWSDGGQGFFSSTTDPVRISPLFKSSTVGKFILQLDTVEQRGTETVYVIRFAAKRATHRTTGTYLQAGYSGKIYVRQQDYAVVRYEAIWQGDTVKQNAVAHKYYGRNNQIAHLYNRVYADERTSHVATYQQAANGRYYVASSVAQSLTSGRVLGKKPFYSQKSCEVYFTAVAPGAAPDVANDPALADKEIDQLERAEYHPAFWQTYQRPAPAGSAPALLPTKP
ncbi:erythromycin esterase family protein [Hymenobacter sublimis]|uniref:Erythromycin esterase family protein n=1 Tax=Hymenobacter sublimis TaxID=2933777 RepID=A0ABY4J7L1_9BACT|nr:erythromycin esterase family protein [Hymenobacter sublimis]UPL48600.1 erythromycin esterase family protein [Hymenobacter sublimis]